MHFQPPQGDIAKIKIICIQTTKDKNQGLGGKHQNNISGLDCALARKTALKSC